MNSMLEGGESLSYKSTLVFQFTRRLERKTRRKNKIKKKIC